MFESINGMSFNSGQELPKIGKGAQKSFNTSSCMELSKALSGNKPDGVLDDTVKPKKVMVGEMKNPDKNYVDKEGKLRAGEPVKDCPAATKENVAKFLESVKSLGLDLTESDIISSSGKLNPNFKIDEQGNISFKNLKAYTSTEGDGYKSKLDGRKDDYFETVNGDWCRDISNETRMEVKEAYEDAFGNII